MLNRIKPIQRTLQLLSLALLSAGTMALSDSDARHLLSRTGFSPTFAEVEALSSLNQQQAIAQIILQAQAPDIQEPPSEIRRPESIPGKTATDEERDAFRKQQTQKGLLLQQWWLEQMLTTSTPFSEQMTLFWHGHFVSSMAKVKFPTLMLEQNQLYREQGLGNYRTLVQEMAIQPAMILYLDTQSSDRRNPNENFARELLELFTLGEGHYSEEDIKAAARAFTGWRVDRRTGKASFSKKLHDPSEKTFFGQSGDYTGEDIIEQIFATKPEQVARHLTTKLWQHFVSSELDESEIDRLSKLFVAADFELQPLLTAMFLTEAFWQEAEQPTLVKSPIDLIVGTQRVFGLNITERGLLNKMDNELGQRLFVPPNVKGWPTGSEWITSASLLARVELLSKVTRSLARMDRNPNMSKRGEQDFALTDFSLSQWQSLLLATDPVSFVLPTDTNPDSTRDYQRVLTALLQDPAFQLK